MDRRWPPFRREYRQKQVTNDLSGSFFLCLFGSIFLQFSLSHNKSQISHSCDSVSPLKPLPLHRISVVATSPHVKIRCIWNKLLCRYISHRGKHTFHAFIFYPKAANKRPSNQQAAKSSGQTETKAISWAHTALKWSLRLAPVVAEKAAKPTTAKEGYHTP